MTAAEDLLAIARGLDSITPAMRRDPLVATQATLDGALALGDAADRETFDWLLVTKALRIVTPQEMAAEFAPARYTNRAARRARAKARRRR